VLAHSTLFRHHNGLYKFPVREEYSALHRSPASRDRLRLTIRATGLRIETVFPKSGPVAQLGARFHGMEEVIGSIPIRSTK
jgi:hypothetical protein